MFGLCCLNLLEGLRLRRHVMNRFRPRPASSIAEVEDSGFEHWLYWISTARMYSHLQDKSRGTITDPRIIFWNGFRTLWPCRLGAFRSALGYAIGNWRRIAASICTGMGLTVGHLCFASCKASRRSFVKEFQHPVQGSTPALLAVSTLLIVLAVLPYSRSLAWILASAGITWHLIFSLWHTGALWQGGRDNLDTAPTLYLPTVAGNFTSAAALGGLGHPDWGWLFLGAGIFSWLALESLIIQRLWHPKALPIAQQET